MKLSVIIPAHHEGRYLAGCLSALRSSSRQPDEVLVVDDASHDNTVNTALQFGAQVLRTPAFVGPAAARNLGASAASGEVLVFLDADFLVYEDTLQKIEQAISANPHLSAVFGSTCAQPPRRSLVSLYQNLQQDYAHQHCQPDAEPFWSGCGAVYRTVFADLGGFRPSTTRSSFEDLDFSWRLFQAGFHSARCQEILVADQKHRTFTDWLKTDHIERTLHRSRLILSSPRPLRSFYADWKSTISALLAWLTVVFLLAAFAAPAVLWGALAAGGAATVIYAPLYFFFLRRAGLRFMFGAALLHTLHLFSSSAIFALVWLQVRWKGTTSVPTSRSKLEAPSS